MTRQPPAPKPDRTPPSLFPRFLAGRVGEALADTPVVLVSGPRQSGKTTLARQFSAGRTYLSLDDAPTLAAAREDPVGLIRTVDAAVIDEVQRAPNLLLAIKKAVDEDRRPGRFLLTGSANLMMLPNVADSLAGRVDNQILLPLAQSEMTPGGESCVDWLDQLFLHRIPFMASPVPISSSSGVLADRVLGGGYPESVARSSVRRRQAWARQYLNMLIQRDVRDLARLDKLAQLPRLLGMMAHVSGQLCNFTQLGGQIGLDHKTVEKYLSVFEQMYLLQRVPVWSGNGLSRLVKTPKLQFIDSGLLAALLEVSDISPIHHRAAFGKLLECFVFGELLKFCTWSEHRYALCFYRDKDQREVDFVLEDAMGSIVGIEVKAAATINPRDFSGLRHLAMLAPERFTCGLVLYDGDETLPMGPRLWAVPIATLWNGKFRKMPTTSPGASISRELLPVAEAVSASRLARLARQ